MWIVLDTNVFFNDWYVKGANFEMLLNYCNNMRYTLLLPQIVVQEVDNKYRQKKDALRQAYAGLMKDSAKLGIELPDELSRLGGFEYSLEKTIKEKYYRVTDVAYSGVDHGQLVRKALKPKLPFRENEKGYRDSLLWLSILNHAKSRNYAGEIAFINQNSKDFFEGEGNEKRLHSDLLEDVQELGITASLSVFSGLKEFIDQRVPQEEHQINWEAFYDEHNSTLDSEACDSAIAYLDDLQIEEVKKLLRDAGHGVRILDSVFAASFDTFDGVEDSEVTSVRSIRGIRSDQGVGTEYFVGYSFDIRTLEVRLLTTTSSYYREKYLFEGFQNLDISDDVVEVVLFLRADFTASIIFDSCVELPTRVDINSVSFRQNHRL
jgi:hypothetical protein